MLQQYRLGSIAVLFLLVASSSIQITAAYALAHIPSIPQVNTGVRIPPKPIQGPNLTVATEDLASSLQRIVTQQIHIIINGQSVSVSPETIRNWLQIATDKGKQVSYIHVKADTVAVSIARLAAPLLKAPINPVIITRPDGTSSTIGTGRNGTALSNSPELEKQISQKLLAAQGFQLDASLRSLPFQTVTAASIAKLLEINIASKQLFAYDSGQLTSSFPISAGAPATPTPIGQFQIYQKLAVQDMRGNNVDGSKYFQPHVHWINYFLPGGYAVHGNYWRPRSYFGAINSSHGCVSLPDTQAKWVYDWAPLGTTVITHT